MQVDRRDGVITVNFEYWTYVDWSRDRQNWINHGKYTAFKNERKYLEVCPHYLEDEEIIDCARCGLNPDSKARRLEPRVNRAYPLRRRPQEHEIWVVTENTGMTVVERKVTNPRSIHWREGSGDFFLVPCRKAKDISQDISLGYFHANERIPYVQALQTNAKFTPGISQKNWNWLTKCLASSIKHGIELGQRKLVEIREAVREHPDLSWQ